MQSVRSPASLWFLLLAWAPATGARAWSDAPICALESRDDIEPLCRAPEPPTAEEPVGACMPIDREPICLWPELDQSHAAFELAAVLEPDAPIERERARESLIKAEQLIAAGRTADALLHLRVVERALPSIGDRIALMRGDLLLKLSMPEQACEAFALAAESPDRGVAARAQVGSVRCAIARGDRRVDQALQALLRRYPLLPERHQLHFELAMVRVQAGQLSSAAGLLRRVDLEAPWSRAAEQARAELDRLSEQGVKVHPLSNAERVDRVERLLREGPLDLGSAEIEALSELPLSAELSARLQQLVVKIARQQGRFEEAAAFALHTRRGNPPPPAPTEELLAPASAAAAERAAAERRIQALRGHKPIARLNNAQLRQVFDLAARHSMKPLCDEALQALTSRKTIVPAARFEAAMLASGLASDDKIAALLQTLLSVPSYRVSARYHYARALERLGKLSEAQAEYQRVIDSDRGQTRYYAMWSDLRLWSIDSKLRESCLPEETASGKRPPAASAQAAAPAAGGAAAAKQGEQGKATPSQVAAAATQPVRSLVGAIYDPTQAGALEPEDEELDDSLKRDELAPASASARPALAQDTPVDASQAARRQRSLALLTPIAARHAEAYPWLVRAIDLIELEQFEEAADEINEAYLAWRDASGAPRLRSGLVTLMSGDAPPRRSITSAIRKARRALDPLARQTLSEVARLLGDPGIGLRFGDFRLTSQPRAYADVVERAARKHGLDPNLLFAVMRVESIYNRRIISNAGAVGLMQIMPHTGQRIARLLGVESFEVSDLLDPALNVEFSAWYLASLLRRFDGHLPLAIASYNGGPHNVRQWMYRSPPDMPLDAFLERIPFTQTHRYVRRVLTYYAAYRAQQNLPMTRLSVELPRPKPDDVAF